MTDIAVRLRLVGHPARGNLAEDEFTVVLARPLPER